MLITAVNTSGSDYLVYLH